MKGRFASVMAAVAMVCMMLVGAPAVSAQSPLVLPAASSEQVQTVAQVPQASQPRIPWDCARYTTRYVICLSKATGTAIVLKKGKVVNKSLRYDRRVRFGGFIDGVDHRTPNGAFGIYYFVKDARSNIYDVDMPYYIKFRGDGIGIHYSEDYDLYGKTISHGCAGTKSKRFARYLFNWAIDRNPLIVVTKN